MLKHSVYEQNILKQGEILFDFALLVASCFEFFYPLCGRLSFRQVMT